MSFSTDSKINWFVFVSVGAESLSRNASSAKAHESILPVKLMRQAAQRTLTGELSTLTLRPTSADQGKTPLNMNQIN